MGIAIGIDLGTTNSCVAVVQGGRARVLEDRAARRVHPSIVSFLENGETVAGYEARDRQLTDPKNTIHSAKRLIGRDIDSEEMKSVIKELPYEVACGPDGIPVVRTRRKEVSLPEVSALMLRHLKKLCMDTLGLEIKEAVITVPANFDDVQRSSTKVAGRIAGFNVLRILNEPTAAALAYGFGAQKTERVAVYDFGGGTFDITIVELSDDIFEVLSTAGDTFLGGDDFDRIIADEMMRELKQQHRIDLSAEISSFQRVRTVAERVKCQLSSLDNVQATLKNLAKQSNGAALDFSFQIERKRFNQLIEPLIARSLTVCDEALRLAGIRRTDLDSLVMVGGTTRTPLVRKMVAEHFGITPRTEINPDEVVAIGAAIQAYSLTGEQLPDKLPKPPVSKDPLKKLKKTMPGIPSSSYHPRPKAKPTIPALRKGRQTASIAMRPSYEALKNKHGVSASVPPSHHDTSKNVSEATPRRRVRPTLKQGAVITLPPDDVLDLDIKRDARATQTDDFGLDLKRNAAPSQEEELGLDVKQSDRAIPVEELGMDIKRGKASSREEELGLDIKRSDSPSPVEELGLNIKRNDPRWAGEEFGLDIKRGSAASLAEEELGLDIKNDGEAVEFEELGLDVKRSASYASEEVYDLDVVKRRGKEPQNDDLSWDVKHQSNEDEVLDLDIKMPSVEPSDTGMMLDVKQSDADNLELDVKQPSDEMALDVKDIEPEMSVDVKRRSPFDNAFELEPKAVSERDFGELGLELLEENEEVDEEAIAISDDDLISLDTISEPPVEIPSTMRPRSPLSEAGKVESVPVVAPVVEEVVPESTAPMRVPSVHPEVDEVTAAPGTRIPSIDPHDTPQDIPSSVAVSDKMEAKSALLLDVTPRALGVAVAGGFCDIIIERNAAIPVEQSRRFTTSTDNQTEVSIAIYQGESRRVNDNTKLGQVVLSNLRAAMRGSIKIKVTFEIDTDGILGVFAINEETGEAQSTKIVLSGGMDEKRVQELVEKYAEK